MLLWSSDSKDAGTAIMMQHMQEVEICEERLRVAMIAGDPEALGELIDDGLVFTGPMGNVITKQEDLEAHRNKTLCIRRLDLFETRLHPINQMVLATTKANLEGTFAGTAVSGVFAYTRLWERGDRGWYVRAGHCSRIGDL